MFPEVSKFIRVCACDRPGTPVGDKPSRSDPVPQPTTAKNAVADLHALLKATGETGPYVLVGHSYGGLVVRLYASIYPKDVAGLVLVDALSEGLRDAETPEQWAIQRKLVQNDVPESLAEYQLLKGSTRTAASTKFAPSPPLHSIPLVVLSADRLWVPQIPAMIKAGNLPKDVPPDFGYVTDAAQKKAQDRARHACAKRKAHHQHK